MIVFRGSQYPYVEYSSIQQNSRLAATQYQEAFLKYVENEYCGKHQRVPVSKLESLPSSNRKPSPMASGFCESSSDPHDVSSDDEEYFTRNNVAETPPGWIMAQHTYWPLPGTIWIHRVKHQWTGGKLIHISMITTPTHWRLAVNFGYHI